jgi:hypothetical protein
MTPKHPPGHDARLGNMRELTASDTEVSNIEQIHSECGAIFHTVTGSGLPASYDGRACSPWAGRHVSNTVAAPQFMDKFNHGNNSDDPSYS